MIAKAGSRPMVNQKVMAELRPKAVLKLRVESRQMVGRRPKVERKVMGSD